MLKAIETDNVIKNIIREILRECSALGIKMTDTLASYVIRLLVANPDYGFIEDKDKPLQREDVEKLVALCVSKLSERNSPSLSTIKMQVYFGSSFPPREVYFGSSFPPREVQSAWLECLMYLHQVYFGSSFPPREVQIAENREGIQTRVFPLIKEIVETNSKTQEDLEKLYRKMIVAIILSSGLGNPTIYPVLREATVALQSVFPASELGQFMSLTKREKEQQMVELTQIVTGIRLFNRDCQKGGEGIDDLPQTLQMALTATQDTLQSGLKKLMGRTDILSAAADAIVSKLMGWTTREGTEEGDEEPGEAVQDEEKDEEAKQREEIYVNLVKGELILARQMEVYIRKLLASVVVSQDSVTELLERLQTRLLQIHDTVRFRTAIPTVQVYPQFIDLSDIWTNLQDEMVLLSIINNTAWTLQTFSTVLDYVPMSVLHDLVGKTPIMTDEERIEATTGYELCVTEDMDPALEIIEPQQITNLEDFPLQYLGFCPWIIVHGTSTLIPANPNMGICRWKDKFYAFSSVQAGTEFCLNPDWYISKALTIARKEPELIQLLQLQEQVDEVKLHGDARAKELETVATSEIDIQTETHPIETYIDPEYTWNIWELKRRALQLANISKCKTHSTQTVRSNFRRGVYIQAAPDKTKGTQTKKDAATNVPTLINYIYGLRGRTDDKQRVITLTRPVHE